MSDEPYLDSLGVRWCPECRCSFGHAAGCPEAEPEPEADEEEEA